MSIEEVAAREISQLMEEAREKDAEIERLREELAAWTAVKQDAETKKLITELANALPRAFFL